MYLIVHGILLKIIKKFIKRIKIKEKIRIYLKEIMEMKLI